MRYIKTPFAGSARFMRLKKNPVCRMHPYVAPFAVACGLRGSLWKDCTAGSFYYLCFISELFKMAEIMQIIIHYGDQIRL